MLALLEPRKGETPMKFMVTWRMRPGSYKTAVQQFLETGGNPHGAQDPGPLVVKE
jgi:hypothetical protein